MKIQNQINLILAFINANEYRRVSRVEINPNSLIAYVFVEAENPTYYTIHSIWPHDEFAIFTDKDIEIALENGTAITMLAAA